ncbi:MAG TPA: hypothetical protein VMX55_01870 [candidate division Zixibacteria bacterium]|nr:hypothetical protein [candidate division Zixibacteria bacterium]
MVNIIVRWLYALFIGSWISLIWFLIGYILTALYFTKGIGLWFLERLGVVFSLYIEEEEERRPFTFPIKITSILWFYISGWWIGIAVIIISIFFIIPIFTFKTACEMIQNIDQVVMAD